MKHNNHNILKKTGILLATILITILLLPVIIIGLLYCPPVQNWAVHYASEVASEKTGMEIRIGRVLLQYPLDLSLDSVYVMGKDVEEMPDIRASIGHAVADVEVWPLLDGNVNVQKLLLENGDVAIDLNYEAPEDTTKSVTPWRINLSEITLKNSKMQVLLKGDTIPLMADVREIYLKKGLLDLENEIYDIPVVTMSANKLSYSPYTITDATAKVEDIHCTLKTNDIALKVTQCTLKEESMAIDLRSLVASVVLDSTQINLDATLHLPASSLCAKVRMDFNAFDNISPGTLDAFMDASIARSDIQQIMSSPAMSASGAGLTDYLTQLPLQPMTLKAEAHGNLNAVTIPTLSVDIPTLLSLDAQGWARDFMPLKDDIYSPLFRMGLKAKATTYRYLLADADVTAEVIGNANATFNASVRPTTGGMLKAKGNANYRNITYNIDAVADRFNVGRLCEAMRKYGAPSLRPYSMGNMAVSGTLHADNRKVTARLTPHNAPLHGEVSLHAMMAGRSMKATAFTDLREMDLYRMRVVQSPLDITLCGQLDIETDMNKYYKVTGLVNDIAIRDTAQTYRPDDLVLDILTRSDTTAAHIYCGDFETTLRAHGGYESLMKSGTRLSNAIMAQWENRTIDQQAVRMTLPLMNVELRCGRENPVYRIARYFDVDFQDIYATIKTSKEDGINGNFSMHKFQTQGYQLDSIDMRVISTNDPMAIAYEGEVRNTPGNEYVFDLLFNGKLLEHGMSLNTKLYDEKNLLGLDLGLEATVAEDAMRLHITPHKPIIAYESFTVNDNNYLLLGKGNRLTGDIHMTSSHGANISLVTEEELPDDVWQDVTLSIDHLDLGRVTSLIPYAPKVEGLLNGDFHVAMESTTKFSVATEMNIKNMIYDGSKVGNLATDFVYMPEPDGTHRVDGMVAIDDRDAATVIGRYNMATDSIDLEAHLLKCPLNLINGFVPDQIIGLEGTGEGFLSVTGTTKKPVVEGQLMLEDAALISIPYGVRMHFDNKPVDIKQSRLLLDDFKMYATNEVPLSANGYVDFLDLDHIMVDLKMDAKNFQLINAEEHRRSEAYGEAFVNFLCYLRGEVDKLRMYGKLEVLPSTNLYYILRDTPLTTDNRLKELVTFTDLKDTVNTVVVRPTVDGMQMNMEVQVLEGAHVKCWMNTDHTNYLDIIGNGKLNMKYDAGDIVLTGRYTITEGEMKYSLPVIPLKTFNIASGSYIEFTGDMMNPRLNITATEETKSAVTIDEVTRMTTFNCGVKISKTLQNMGLEFIIDSPEDQAIADQLAMMSQEGRGKIAVTMLTTGMYLADGNTSAFSMNSALNSFLQSEINNIAGNALKTMDVSMGMETSTEEDGTRHTDYTFKFAKRFWNNRLSISVGGKISSGPDVAGQNRTFFDNVDVQYRLSDTSNQYMKLFYKNAVYDFLEGYVGQFGAGYMYKRKMDYLFKKNNKETAK